MKRSQDFFFGLQNEAQLFIWENYSYSSRKYLVAKKKKLK
jgi:hypothetical protein